MSLHLLLRCSFVLLLSACGGSVSITLAGDGEQEALAGSQVTFAGTLDTEGALQGEYTLTTDPDASVEYCRVSVDDGTQETSLAVDTTDEPSVELLVTMVTLASATNFASCQLTATLDRDETTSASHAATVRIVAP